MSEAQSQPSIIVIDGKKYSLVPIIESEATEQKIVESPAVSEDEVSPSPVSSPPLTPASAPEPIQAQPAPKLQKVSTTDVDGKRVYEYRRPSFKVDPDGNLEVKYSTIRRTYTPRVRTDERRNISKSVIAHMKEHPEQLLTIDSSERYRMYCEQMQSSNSKPYAFKSFLQQFNSN